MQVVVLLYTRVLQFHVFPEPQKIFIRKEYLGTFLRTKIVKINVSFFCSFESAGFVAKA